MRLTHKLSFWGPAKAATLRINLRPRLTYTSVFIFCKVWRQQLLTYISKAPCPQEVEKKRRKMWSGRAKGQRLADYFP